MKKIRILLVTLSILVLLNIVYAEENSVMYLIGEKAAIKAMEELKFEKGDTNILLMTDAGYVPENEGYTTEKALDGVAITSGASVGKRNLINVHRPYNACLLYTSACDIAVFPSKYEPFGIVCTEAMSMAKPVVVGAVGTSGLREQVILVGENACGFHVNPYDPTDIAKFVVNLLKDEDLRKKIGENARRRVIKKFTWERSAKETLNIYNELL